MTNNTFKMDELPKIETSHNKGSTKDNKEESICIESPQTISKVSPLVLARVFKKLKGSLKWIFFLSYIIYFIAALLIQSKKDEEDYWCNGDGLLITINAIIVSGLLYFKIIKRFFFPYILKKNIHCQSITTILNYRYSSIIVYTVMTGGFLAYVLLDSEDYSRIIPLFGTAFFMLVAALLSISPKHIQVRQIFWGIGLQVAFAMIIIRWNVGASFFQCIGNKTQKFFSYTDLGSGIVFGEDILASKAYAFVILPVILFFGMFISILFYYGILQWVIVKLGWLLEATIGTTPCESMAAIANVFLGQAEAPLVVRPYISQLTKSELHAVLAGGFSTIAGGSMAAYVSFGVSASHLLSASIMSAPAAMVLSKIIYPETEESQTASKNIKLMQRTENSVIHAIMNGILAGIPLIANITASILCSFAFMGFFESLVDWGCQLLNFEEGTCSLKLAFGYLLFPITWLMGVPTKDCLQVGYLLGTKILLSDFIAYHELMTLSKKGLLTEQAVMISTYALCGFGSIASIGNQLGSLGSMAPEQRPNIVKVILRAFMAGNMASFVTACIAGTLAQETSVRAFSQNVTSEEVF